MFTLKPKYLIRLCVVTIILVFSNIANAQAQNPQIVAQVRAMLSSKGLQEEEVKTRLKSKGIDVDKMTEQELLSNKALIEQTLNEMEAEKSQKQAITPIVVTPNIPSTDTPKNEDKNSDGIELVAESKIEENAEKEQAEVLSKLAPSSIYGHKIFRENSISIYRVSKDASPPESYVLGPGDKINVLIFGKSQADLQYEINAGGFIQPNLMPKIFLSGITLKQAKELLYGRFSIYYTFNKDQFALTLHTSRTVTINIFGEVEKQGSYTTSALNTALNSLAVSGGPTEIGSVRNIQIIRGKTKKILDVYAFMRNPITQFDYYLQNNDIIYVPPAEKIVTLEGSVNRPMKYELKSGEDIADLIEYAGGLKVDAYSEFIQIQSFRNNQIVLNDYVLSDILSEKIKLDIKHGDIIRLKSISKSFKSFVSITGAIKYPDKYDINSTKSIKVLLNKAIIIPETKTDQAFILRSMPDSSVNVIAFSIDDIVQNRSNDILLQGEDQVFVYDKATFTNKFAISILGDVRKPFERIFRFDDRLKLSEAINFAGGLEPTAADFGYIYRTDPFDDTKTTYLPINISQSQDSLLRPGDKLIILNKNSYAVESSISLGGDVKTPIQLRYDSSLSVRDLILLAGGLTISSDYKYVEVFRMEFEFSKTPIRKLIKLSLDKDFNLIGASSDFRLRPFDMVIVRRISEFGFQETVQLRGEVFRTGEFFLKKNQYRFSDLIEESGGFTENADIYNTTLIRYVDNSGVIIFNALDALTNKGNLKKDPILWKQDFVNVPKMNNTVQIEASGTNYILGANQRVLQITYQGKLSAAKYVRNFAGGFVKQADLKNIRVVSINGTIRSTKSFLFIKKYPKIHPGDKILIPYKIPPDPKEKREVKPLDWDKFVTRLMAMATTLLLIKAYAN